MFCVLSLFTYPLFDQQKLTLLTSKIIILILYLYIYINFANTSANLQIVIYNLHYTLRV